MTLLIPALLFIFLILIILLGFILILKITEVKKENKEELKETEIIEPKIFNEKLKGTKFISPKTLNEIRNEIVELFLFLDSQEYVVKLYSHYSISYYGNNMQLFYNGKTVIRITKKLPIKVIIEKNDYNFFDDYSEEYLYKYSLDALEIMKGIKQKAIHIAKLHSEGKLISVR